MLVVIDNYDSFTYNLVQYLGELGADPVVFRNDKITVGDMSVMRPKQIIISPGPGRPEGAGISNDAIAAFAGKIPILGVCLGHQCIGHVFGGKIVGAERLMHGKISRVYHNGEEIFKGLENPFDATRYHSLIVEKVSLPGCLEITARTGRKEIMGVCHREFTVYGVQFHPESILTTEGKKLLNNFLQIGRGLR